MTITALIYADTLGYKSHAKLKQNYLGSCDLFDGKCVVHEVSGWEIGLGELTQ